MSTPIPLHGSGLTGPINVDPFRRATVIFVLNPTRIRLNFSNREPSRISPVASNPRTETHQMQNFFEARLKTWDELHNAVLCNLLFSLKDNIPRMPIYYPTITLTAANARFCLCTTTTRFLYCVVHCVFGNFHFAHQARSPLLLSQCDISVALFKTRVRRFALVNSSNFSTSSLY